MCRRNAIRRKENKKILTLKDNKTYINSLFSIKLIIFFKLKKDIKKCGIYGRNYRKWKVPCKIG